MVVGTTGKGSGTTTASPTGKLLRRVLSGELASSEWATAALFFSDRVQHNMDPENGIRRRLRDGETVLLDRYYFSTFAYQGQNTDLDWVMRMHYECPEITRPDLVLFLSMPPEKCLRRITEGRTPEQLEIYETLDRLTDTAARFDDVFSRLKDLEHVVRIDADGTPEAVALRVRNAVCEKFFQD